MSFCTCSLASSVEVTLLLDFLVSDRMVGCCVVLERSKVVAEMNPPYDGSAPYVDHNYQYATSQDNGNVERDAFNSNDSCIHDVGNVVFNMHAPMCCPCQKETH